MTNKIQITFNQLKKFLTEDKWYNYSSLFKEPSEEEKKGRKRARDLFARVDEEINAGDFGYALNLLKKYKDEIYPFFPEDWEKAVYKLENIYGA